MRAWEHLLFPELRQFEPRRQAGALKAAAGTPAARSGAVAIVTALSPVTNSGCEVTVAARIMPIQLRDRPDSDAEEHDACRECESVAQRLAHESVVTAIKGSGAGAHLLNRSTVTGRACAQSNARRACHFTMVTVTSARWIAFVAVDQRARLPSAPMPRVPMSLASTASRWPQTIFGAGSPIRSGCGRSASLRRAPRWHRTGGPEVAVAADDDDDDDDRARCAPRGSSVAPKQSLVSARSHEGRWKGGLGTTALCGMASS